MGAWEWDPTLYAGSAAYYVRGRAAYPQAIADRLASELALDGSGHLLDVGCGPGSLTLLLAPLFARATGVDADPEMLAEAERQASLAGIANVDWVHLRAEDLPGPLGRPLGGVDVVTLAQSFHWMDRPVVAGILHGTVAANGALVHVSATTHQGIETDEPLPHPRPPRRQIDTLVESFLGPGRRAGQGTLTGPRLTEAEHRHQQSEIYRAAGFTLSSRTDIPGRVVVRDVDEVVASVLSLSYATPHLFGERLPSFEAELRALLQNASPDGRFSEQLRETTLEVWRP